MKRIAILFVLLACLSWPINKSHGSNTKSAWALYESVVTQIKNGEVEQAKMGLTKLLDGLERGKFIECSQEHTVRLLQYKAHVVLANIAFAEKNKEELNRELFFFEDADTTKIEWKNARYAATHFEHKLIQLSHGSFGKVLGDWVSTLKGKDGNPVIWIRVIGGKAGLSAELKECMLKNLLSQKDNLAVTNMIVVNNVDDVIELNFGDNRLNPGLEILPNVLTDAVNSMGKTASEMIGQQSIIKHGTPYSAESLGKQLGVDLAVGLASALIAQLSVTKETVTSERIVMEQIAPELYMAKIRFRSLTVSSDGKSNDVFHWAEIPVMHLYPSEQLDFSNGHFDASFDQHCNKVLKQELFWDYSDDNKERADLIKEDFNYSCRLILYVESTRFNTPFYFLGQDINFHSSDNYSSFFTGLARAKSLWGFKEQPISPKTNRSEVNPYITPLRGEIKTVISPYECVTFNGDWNVDEKCGNGLLTYINTKNPEFSFSYEGTIWKGYPHGRGIWQGSDYRYVGWFYKGEKFGYGTMSYEDGTDEQGFVTSQGDMVKDSMVTPEMLDDFNKKVNKISKYKYNVLSYDE